MLKLCVMFLIVVVSLLSVAAQPPRHKSKKPVAPLDRSTTVAEEVEQVPEGRISIHHLKRKLEAKEPIVIIDNRTGGSWLGSLVKIPGAIHMPVDELPTRLDELPKDREIVTYCA